jgi:hypothetical protein
VCVFVNEERVMGHCEDTLSLQASLHDVYMQACFVVDSVDVVVVSVSLLLSTRCVGLLTLCDDRKVHA